MSFFKFFNTKCQNYFILFKHFVLILLFLYCSTRVVCDERKLGFEGKQNQQDIVEVDSDTSNNKHNSCKQFLACERRRVQLQNQGNHAKLSCLHLLNQENEFGVQLRHKRRISSKRKMRSCLQKINRNKKHSIKNKELSPTQVVVAGVGTIPASHLFPITKQQIIPYGNKIDIENVLVRNPTPSESNEFSTDYSTTTTTTTIYQQQQSQQQQSQKIIKTKNKLNLQKI
uniref:Uncharacterized protein n=1 Tax=Meloidogyne enterolobii TaxID=390850 RepID=A0A6V7Y677_MELEN|nr:unnamed protein product [Meloidogyne enterolobii]